MATLEQASSDLSTASAEALDRLIVLGNDEQSALAKKLRRAAQLEQLNAAIGEFETGTAAIVDLTLGLDQIIASLEVNPAGDLLDRFNRIWDQGANLLGDVQGALGTVSASDDEAEASEPETEVPEVADTPAPVEPAGPPVPLPAPPAVTATPAALPAISKSKKFSALEQEFAQFFDTCVIRPDRQGAVEAIRQKIMASKARYQAVAEPLGIPWYFLGPIHALESSLNFKTHLHNGDPLSRRTVHVPPGRPKDGEPPFTWEASATDAMKLKNFDERGNWSVPAMLYRWEAYNGFGYRNKGLPTPYLWSFTNQYEKGKYVADGKFDPNAVSRQCGAAALLRLMVNLGDIVIP